MRKIGWKLCPGLVAAAYRYHVHRGAELHGVTLTWQAPPPGKGVTVVWYNVYRRTGEGGSFVKIADREPGPSYEDLLANSGKTQIYVVTSGLCRLGMCLIGKLQNGTNPCRPENGCTILLSGNPPSSPG
jgi:hypothetical protein